MAYYTTLCKPHFFPVCLINWMKKQKTLWVKKERKKGILVYDMYEEKKHAAERNH